MRSKYRDHSAFVEEWLDDAGRGLDCERLLELLQQAVRVVWDSARVSISDVTLDAVLERVVINARDHFPWLPALPVVHSSIDTSVLRAHCGRAKLGEILKASRFIVTEFLAINGNLTGEALTPAMHRGLAKARWKKPKDSPKSGESAL